MAVKAKTVALSVNSLSATTIRWLFAGWLWLPPLRWLAQHGRRLTTVRGT